MHHSPRDPTVGAVVAFAALLVGIGLAMLDMLNDNLILVVALLGVAGFIFGALAPRWALLAGLLIGAMIPVAKMYVNLFNVSLPHPMHGFFGGALAVIPPVATALAAMWIRDRIQAVQRRRRMPRETRTILVSGMGRGVSAPANALPPSRISRLIGR
jgi:hypothetical protein